MDQEFKEQIYNISNEWDIAEEYIKIAEQLDGKAIIPSICELRYCGRKILEAINVYESDNLRARSILSDALHDCYRARHDAVDASISIINSKLDQMINRLGYTKLTAAEPQLGSLLLSITDAQKKIATSRSDRLNRNQLYEALKNVDLVKIRRAYDRLKASEGHIITEVRRERGKLLISYGIGVLGIIVPIVFWLI